MCLLNIPFSENHKSLYSAIFLGGMSALCSSRSLLPDCKLMRYIYAYFLINMPVVWGEL